VLVLEVRTWPVHLVHLVGLVCGAEGETSGMSETEEVVLSFELRVLSSELSVPCRGQRNQINKTNGREGAPLRSRIRCGGILALVLP
jgi:hypothetical protein